MTSIIERLEGLTGPCRKTDNLIGVAVGNTNLDWGMSHPAYTASIDQALSLFPVGSDWEISAGPSDAAALILDSEHRGEGPNPAIAMCIAALKARGVS